MVQRKAPNNKLGIQATDAKSEKLLLSKNLKATSFYQHQDGKTRGHEMKKIVMKRSSSSSSSSKRNSQPGRPPPPSSSLAGMATPQKQPPEMMRSSWSPNYMKSTSSSEAKKESSQVSSNSPGRRKSNGLISSSGSGSKQVNNRSLTKSSSLKLVRTLTKTPSFKHVRTQSKKYSRVVLCADMNSQRATCSSTLKDMKSPAYLSLSPGATEAEGTSAIRVCPYTYCSLNGHHHAPLPPLKCFLATRRRMLKTQKSVKLEALSPRRVKPVDAGEGGMDFFIEIYAKNEDGKGESPFGGGDVERNDEKQVALSLTNSSPHSEIDFEEGVEQYGEITSLEVDTIEDVGEEQTVEVVKKEYLPVEADQSEAAAPESFYNGSEFEEDSSSSSAADESSSEMTDMEWEEDHGEILADEGTEESAVFDKGDEENDIAMDDDANQNLSDSLNLDQDLSAEKDEISLNGIVIASDIVDRIVEQMASREETQENNIVPKAENGVTETGFKHGYVEINCDVLHIDGADTEMMDKKVAVCDFSAVSEVSKTEAGVQTEEKDRVVVMTRSIGVQFPEIEEDEEQVVVTKVSIGIQVPDFDDSFYDEHQDDAEVEANQHQEKNAAPCQIEDLVEDNNTSQEEILPQENPSENHNDNVSVADNLNEDNKFKIQSSIEEQIDSNENIINLAETETKTVDKMEVEESNQQETEAETPPIASSTNISQQEKTASLVDSKLNPEQPVTCSNPTWKKGSKRTFSDEEELRKFNPKDPNFLPEVPEPDPEKVDLKHQEIDERKNSEEWMVDYALRQTVTKLAPARNKKVALLVEAFETVTPVPKYKSHRKHSSAAFAPARPMQACS